MPQETTHYVAGPVRTREKRIFRSVFNLNHRLGLDKDDLRNKKGTASSTNTL